ncbi:MAG: transcription antitermination factor NusB [Nitrospirae bacterium CG_4_9_14_3_um_filter_53_35]|nr:MAG: transcription antitermination factor NusB [Nitrospirae bacterium CG2_30_53_67]PJA77403.1 MAG: transcription antitermination factor NusB [Nitrospirae bacterium CG_4_9_14_3_um_filter_53_35]
MGKRRKSRALTLQLLYQYEIRKEPPMELLKEFWKGQKSLDKDIRSFAESIFIGTVEQIEKIDLLISELSLHWKLSRISMVDKNILRLAIYEICFREDIPEKVTIDEAIELARQYSGDDAGSFINGILDKVLKEKERYMEKYSLI